ncbi:hypothetical protein Q8A73_024412, partial [Channa argus]
SVYTRWRLQWNSFFQHVGIGGSVVEFSPATRETRRWRLQWNSFLRHMGIGGSVVEFSPLHLQILTPLGWHETQQREKGSGAVEHNVGIGSSVVMRLVCGLVCSTDGPSRKRFCLHAMASSMELLFPTRGHWWFSDSVYTRWRLQWNSFFQHVGIGGSYVVLMDHQEKDSVYTRWRLQWNTFFQHVGIGGSVVEFSPATHSVYTRWRLQWNSFFQHVGIGGSVVEFSPATRETGVRFPANESASLKCEKVFTINNSVYTRWHLQWNSFFQHVGIGGSVGWAVSETVLPFSKTFCPKYKLQMSLVRLSSGAVEHNVGIGSSVVMRLVCGLVRSTDGPSKNILSTRNGVFNGTPFSGTWALYVVLMDHQEKDSVYTRWRLQWNSFFQHVGIGVEHNVSIGSSVVMRLVCGLVCSTDGPSRKRFYLHAMASSMELLFPTRGHWWFS